MNHGGGEMGKVRRTAILDDVAHRDDVVTLCVIARRSLRRWRGSDSSRRSRGLRGANQSTSQVRLEYERLTTRCEQRLTVPLTAVRLALVAPAPGSSAFRFLDPLAAP